MAAQVHGGTLGTLWLQEAAARLSKRRAEAEHESTTKTKVESKRIGARAISTVSPLVRAL